MLLNKQLKENKFQKYHKIKKSGLKIQKINNQMKNTIVLKAKTNGVMSIQELNSIYLILKKKFKKKEFKIKILIDFFTTKKPLETRMGKGKGSLDKKVSWIKKGQNIIEFNNINLEKKITILKSIKKKSNINLNLDSKSYNW